MTIDTHLATRGPALAAAFDARRDTICDRVTIQLMLAYPDMCQDTARPDALSFQQNTFHQTPRRFHTMLQAALRFRTLTVAEQEYRWLWGILPRHGVTQNHMLHLVRAYFDAARAAVNPVAEDRVLVRELETSLVRIVMSSRPE